jgi:hypothetical protein
MLKESSNATGVVKEVLSIRAPDVLPLMRVDTIRTVEWKVAFPKQSSLSSVLAATRKLVLLYPRVAHQI